MYKPQSHIQQLADHIEKNLNKGYTPDALRFSLMDQGYSRISVEKAIEIVNKKLSKEIPPIKEKPTITYKVATNIYKEPIEVPIQRKTWWQKLFN